MLRYMKRPMSYPFWLNKSTDITIISYFAYWMKEVSRLYKRYDDHIQSIRDASSLSCFFYFYMFLISNIKYQIIDSPYLDSKCFYVIIGLRKVWFVSFGKWRRACVSTFVKTCLLLIIIDILCLILTIAKFHIDRDSFWLCHRQSIQTHQTTFSRRYFFPNTLIQFIFKMFFK